MSEARELIQKILNAEKAGDIFSPPPVFKESELRKTYHEYAKLIHPDICKEPEAQTAFRILKEFYEYALKDPYSLSISKPRYGQNYLIFKAQDILAFELGARYVMDNKIVYMLDSGKEPYWTHYMATVTGKRVKCESNPDIKKLYIPLMPEIISSYATEDSGRYALIIRKKSNEYPLDLFLKAYKDKLGGRDIAWIISRMIDLCCFMRCAGIPMVLNGFSERNLFINPDLHSIHIYGGWWYARPLDQKMIGTSKDVYSCMSPKTKTDKLADSATDIECVRSIARSIKDGKLDIPKSMRDWINAGSSYNPIEEKSRWDLALERAYGPKKFTKFEYDPNKIYNKGA